MRRALAADPEFLSAALEYPASIVYRGDLRTEYQRSVAETRAAFPQCMAIVLAAPSGYPAGAADGLLALEQEHQSSACSSAYLGFVALDLTPSRVWYERGLEYLSRAIALRPDVPALWQRRAVMLLRLGRATEARAALLIALSHAPDAMHRVPLYHVLVGALASTLDSVRVPELQRALAAAVTRDGRPGVRYLYPDYVRYLEPEAAQLPSWERTWRERIRLAVETHNAATEWGARRSFGAILSDAGRPVEALRELERVVAIADSTAAPLMQLEAYRFRGRTYAKLGRFKEAEQDLRHAIALGSAAHEPYFLAEAWHNLAHVYEGVGRMTDAAHAVDRFIELTRPLQHAQPRMMSLHDAGIIRWKAGWAAAANEAFDDMVRVVDEQERGYYWAGEHFEQTGDLARALSYFEKGTQLDIEERSLNLGGAARVLQALGKLHSAEAAARAHDSAMSNQVDVPLLPPILAAAGRAREALEISRAWARKQVAQGNLQGAAIATNGLAELLLSSGDPKKSLAEAAAAESLAQRANLTDELIRARRVKGESEVGLGDARGLVTLREAAALAEAHPSSEGVLQTQLALAKALASLGRITEALVAYDRSARVVERITERLNLDLDRARFRDHQLAAFDGAVELLLGQPSSAAQLAALTSWSQRRKAASLALAAGVRQLGTLDRTALQQRLPARSALLDYLTVRDRAAALVVTAEGERLVELPLKPDSLRVLADRLRKPLERSYAGRLDLARAPYDLPVAQQLYAALLAPLEPLLVGVDHLLIVPDGPLHYVPFDGLVSELPSDSPEPAGAAFAVDRFQIELLPSAQFLPPARPRLKQHGGARVLVIAHDAPGADRETAAIKAAWPAGEVTVLSGDAATEGALRNARGFNILHFAAHAEADDREPLASHLRLAPDSADDGFLHLGEISAQQHTGQLVILSACETLSGTLFRGEGLMGLGRAFITAGAMGVVATQWPIGPSSAELMAEFHRKLAAGVDAAAALREAKQALRRYPATAHPFYWAGFVLLLGAPGPGVIERRTARLEE